MSQVTSALPGNRRPVLLIARSLVALTKPRIIELLLVTTLPVMFLAAHGVPPATLVAVTLVGGALAAASANTARPERWCDSGRLGTNIDGSGQAFAGHETAVLLRHP